MKKRTVLPRLILWLMFNLIFGVPILEAQNASVGASQNEPVLSGSGQKSEDVATKADAIFVGEITAIGFGNSKATGESAYRGVQVKVVQVLRGTVEASVTVTLHVVGVLEFHEASPKAGNSYIFFVKKNAPGQPDPYTAFKLLPATDINITKVKKLIAATPAPK